MVLSGSRPQSRACRSRPGHCRKHDRRRVLGLRRRRCQRVLPVLVQLVLAQQRPSVRGTGCWQPGPRRAARLGLAERDAVQQALAGRGAQALPVAQAKLVAPRRQRAEAEFTARERTRHTLGAPEYAARKGPARAPISSACVAVGSHVSAPYSRIGRRWCPQPRTAPRVELVHAAPTQGQIAWRAAARRAHQPPEERRVRVSRVGGSLRALPVAGPVTG